MKIQKRELFYFIFIGIIFYILPLFIIDTGSAMFILLCAIPILLFFISCFYGFNKNTRIIYPIIGTLLFIPTIFIYYNSSAKIYILIFGIVIFLGYFIGKGLFKVIEKYTHKLL